MKTSRALAPAPPRLSALLACAGSAVAGGPDVIVGDISNAETFGSQTVNGVTRYSYCLGTTSCNVGNQNLLWIASTNEHPVIGQNVYRLKNNRMEQIGLSWLKNGFTALTQNLCSTCNGDGGAVLGVGCSDPYSGTLNGSQTRLGPRSWVNPATGAYVYNPSGWPATPTAAGIIGRRLQILSSDLDPALNPGAVYYGETQYITPDDGGAGNGWNNVSYRPMAFGTTTTRTASVTGATARIKCALEAWAAADATVSVFPLDVPGDGRLFVACRVSDNGNGTWHYEYAVENITSDRAGGSFIIPIPAGATVTNAELRNPFYHSGEPYDNRPFLPQITSSAVTFLPQELSTIVGTGPAAGEAPWSTTGVKATIKNAVRWGSTYNFRFDCTAAPALGSGTLGFDKPGVGAFVALNNVTFSIKTPGGATETPVVFNDQCSSPGTLHDGPNGWSNVGATSSGFGAFADGGSSALDADVWFVYTASAAALCSGNITFTTCGSDFAAKVSVYSACPTGPGTELACAAGNLTSCGSGPAQSSVAVPTGSAQLFVRIGSVTGSTGNLVINVTSPACLGACCAISGSCSIASPNACTNSGGTFRGDGITCPSSPACPTPPPPPIPANDACANAQWLADGVAIIGATNQATFSAAEVTNAGCFSVSSRDVWFKYKPVSGATVNVNTCGSGFDTVLTIHTGSCGSLTQVWCNDDNTGGSGATQGNNFCSGSSNNAGLNYAMTAGTTYMVRVAGYNGAMGNFRVVAIGGGGVIPPAPPANDACASAATVTDGSTAFTTAGATTDGTAPTCSGIASGNIDLDAWFSYTAPITGRLTAGTCTSSFNTRMAVYSGATCTGFDARLLACNDDDATCPGGTGTQSRLTLDVTQGSVYLIRVGGTAGASGAGTLALATAPYQGACCNGTVCSVATQAACATGYQGDNTVCGPMSNPTTCCKANFSQSNGVSIDDLFLYFNAYFQGDPAADINGADGTSIDDLFQYIELWFVGC